MPKKTRDLRQDLVAKEKEIDEQIERIFDTVKEERPESGVEEEFKKAVQKFTERYQLLLLLLESEKQEIDEQTFKERFSLLKAQYKNDLVSLAAAIDAALEKSDSANFAE